MNDTRLTKTPPGVWLGMIDIVPDGGARNFVLQIGTGRFHGFVVRKGNIVRGYVDQCPHMGLLLAKTLDAYLSPAGDLIACSWHGALFDKEFGICVAGPCGGKKLTTWSVGISDGALVTV